MQASNSNIRQTRRYAPREYLLVISPRGSPHDYINILMTKIWKLALTHTPHSLWSTRQDPDPNLPKGGYLWGDFLRGNLYITVLQCSSSTTVFSANLSRWVNECSTASHHHLHCRATSFRVCTAEYWGICHERVIWVTWPNITDIFTAGH